MHRAEGVYTWKIAKSEMEMWWKSFFVFDQRLGREWGRGRRCRALEEGFWIGLREIVNGRLVLLAMQISFSYSVHVYPQNPFH